MTKIADKLTVERNNLKVIANIPPEEILFLQADNNYTRIFLTGGKKLLSGFNLKKYEDFFEPEEFLRVNRSFLINRRYIKRYDALKSMLYLKNGRRIGVSRRRREFIEKKVI